MHFAAHFSPEIHLRILTDGQKFTSKSFADDEKSTSEYFAGGQKSTSEYFADGEKSTSEYFARGPPNMWLADSSPSPRMLPTGPQFTTEYGAGRTTSHRILRRLLCWPQSGPPRVQREFLMKICIRCGQGFGDLAASEAAFGHQGFGIIKFKYKKE